MDKILKELKYQTKLLEAISMNTEPQKQNVEMSKSITQSMDLLKTQLMNNPGIKDNPEIGKMMQNIFNTIPEGV